MKKKEPWVLIAVLFSVIQVVGCSKPAPVDPVVNKKTANFSAAHRALLDQRKKQDGD